MRGKKIINFLTLVITTLIIFLLLEISLRAFYPQPVLKRSHIEASPPIFQEGRNIPWELKPSTEARHLQIFGEWNVSVKINELGLRDQNYNLESDSNKKKILMLGDSFTFGHGVEEEESYVGILEELVSPDYNIINAGWASGYSSDIGYIYLKEKGLQFKPDIVILGFFIGNDITDLKKNEWIELNEMGLPKKIISNYHYIDEQGRLRSKGDENVIENNPFPLIYGINVFLSYRSHTYIFFKDRLKSLFYKLTGQEEDLGKSIYGEVYYEPREVLWKKVENVLLGMNSLLKENGIDFVIVLIPSKDQFRKEKDESYNFTNPNDRIVSFGQENDLLIIDLLPYFKEENIKKFYYKKDPHWNPYGHKFAAEKIYSGLKKLWIL